MFKYFLTKLIFTYVIFYKKAIYLIIYKYMNQVLNRIKTNFIA